MKDLKHIKGFNESEENLNISDVRSSNPHLDFLDEVVEKLNKLKEESHGRGYVDEQYVDFIEQLHSTYSFFFDTEERFVN